MPPEPPGVQPWPKISSRPVGDFRIFTIRSELKVNPRTGRHCDLYVIDTTNWVNVIAITPQKQLVMVEQFRHGSETVELEIPGGMMDPGESDPIAAGLRELREETGYVGDNPRLIGRVFPNAAIMSNTCHTLLVENCHLTHDIELDQGEDLVTRLVPIDEVASHVLAGRVQHALVVAALHHFELWRKTDLPAGCPPGVIGPKSPG